MSREQRLFFIARRREERKEKQKFFEKLLTRRNEMKYNFDLAAATAATKSSLKTRQRTDKRERGERKRKLQSSGLESKRDKAICPELMA